MGRRRSRMSYTPQRSSVRSSSGSGLIGVIFVVFITLVALGIIVQFLQTPSGVAFVLVVIASVIAFFVWRNHKRNQQRQAWLIQQQQQAAWNQHQQQIQWQQQQEAAKQQYARQEWERQERERQDRERFAQLHSLGDLLALTPKEFEQMTAKLLEASGLQNVQVVGGSGDLAADILARDSHGKSVVVQCKRYAPGNTIGSGEIQKFIGMKNTHHMADIGIFVTTSVFTQPAIDLAQQHNILLWDKNMLVNLVQNYFSP